MEYDQGITALLQLKEEIKKYGTSLSETDTRVKIIDKILIDCLGWTEKEIRREEHVNAGYIDYIIRFGKKGLIVEAKKIGTFFELPIGINYSSNLTISKLFLKNKELNQHFEQVEKYCLDSGIQFGCFTNGLSWVVFPAIRTDGIRLHNSKIVVFRGVEDIEKNFLHFWNILSKIAIEKDEINRILLPESKHIPHALVINSDDRREQLLNRNLLSSILQPILPKYFGDLVDSESLNMLKKCYVETVPSDSRLSEKRGLSHTIGQDPTVRQYYTTEKVYSDLHRSIEQYTKNQGRSGVLYILLGRVGSGKSTFLYHYLFVDNVKILTNHFVFYLNWLEYDGQKPIKDFFYEKIDNLTKKSSLYTTYSSYSNLEKVFQEDILVLNKGPLGNIKDENFKQQKISEFLIDYSTNPEKKDQYYFKMFNYLRKKHGISSIIMFDNIDQLTPELQENIIKFSFSIYERWTSFTLIALREENYYKSKREGRLSTIQCSPIHFPLPTIIPIIIKRLDCFADDLGKDSSGISEYLSEKQLTSNDLQDYIKLVVQSLNSEQDKVKKFLEAIALGNLRDSLEFFRNFLIAGNTNSAKIIEIMKKSDKIYRPYLIPDHEFIKSISLGSRRFFSETHSPILNVYSIADSENPSHFTKLRLLKILQTVIVQQRSYGKGYETIKRLNELLKSIGTSEFDIKNSLESLTLKGLIENDLHSKKYFEKVNAVRITPAGNYYINYLCSVFVYIDLMQQDTPIYDEDTFNQLDQLASSTLLDERIKRCKIFIEYLSNQESQELSIVKKITNNDLLTTCFMQQIKEKCDFNISKIQTKLEKYSK